MGIKHDRTVAKGDTGAHTDWNANHVIDGDVEFNQYQMIEAVAENRTTWPAGPVEGQLIYRSDQHTFYHWNGTTWVAVVSPATIVVATDGSGHTTDIQEGIDMLTADGGIVYIKEGTYTITSTINITIDNIVVRGTGRGTIIKIGDGADCDAINLDPAVGDNINGIILQDFKINGNKAEQTANGIGITTAEMVQYFTLSRLFIEDTRSHGIRCLIPRYGRIIDCSILEAGGDGIKIDKQDFTIGLFCLIQGNYIYLSGANGINIDGIAHSIIAENNAVANTTDGFNIVGGRDGCLQCNATAQNGAWGIDIDNTSNRWVILGNNLYQDTTGGLNNNSVGSDAAHNLTTAP